MRPGHDEGRPASRPLVNPDPTSTKSPVLSQDAMPEPQDARWRHGVAQHITLPRDLTSRWAATVMLSPPRRAVVIDALDCQTWTAEALHTLAGRLAGRDVEVLMAPAALTFWLRNDMTAFGGYAA